MSRFDPNKFRLTDSNARGIKQPPVPERKIHRSRRSNRFLKGPIPIPWLIAAAKLPGKTMVVGIVIWFRAGLCKSLSITLPSTVLMLFGIDRSAKSRALSNLESAGLITVERQPGKNPTVTILDLEK